jgi:basic membrane protein A and related proteins
MASVRASLRRTLAAAALLFAPMLLVPGCELVVDDRLGRGIGESCGADTDCQASQCTEGLCTVTCASGSDCPAPSTCTSAGHCEVPLKVGFVYVGVLEDEGWTLTHEQGRVEATSRLSYLETDVATNIFLPDDITNVVDDFILREGANVIVANSFSQRDAILASAKKYPDVKFLICSGNETAPNVGTYFARMEQAYFIAGYIAGQISKTKRLGFVGSYQTPEVVRHANAFTRGARRADPSIVVEIRWEGFWFDLDPPVDGEYNETRLAKALLGSGCDVLAHNMDNGRVNRAVEAARKNGAEVYSVGNDNRDACDQGPTSCIGTSYWSWGTLYTQIFEQMHRNQWDPSIPINENITANPATTPVGFAVNATVTGPDVAIAANELLGTLAKPGGGRLPFTGPFCSTGQRAACVAEGETISDEELQTMCWFVEGLVQRSDPDDPTSADVPAQVPEACLTQQ